MYGIKDSTIKNCDQVWDEFQNINDRILKEEFDICIKDYVTLNDSTSIKNFLQQNVETIYCSMPLKTLEVPRPYVALASYPGSGNTWTRLLIERATGM